jgi:YidC/Oxa1 family membrane protein insertase
MDLKNTLAAVSLSAAIIVLWGLFFAPSPQEVNEAKLEKEKNEITQNEDAPKLIENEEIKVLSRDNAINQADRIIFENENIVGSISLTGAVIDDLTFKKYTTSVNGDEKVTLLNPKEIKTGYYIDSGWAISNNEIETPNKKTVWEVEGNNKLTPNTPIKLKWTKNNITFEKIIKLDDKFLFNIEQKITNNSEKTYNFYPYGQVIRNTAPEVTNFYILHEGLLGVFDGDLVEEDYDDIEEKSYSKNAEEGYVAIVDKYWVASIIPEENKSFRADFDYKNKFKASFIENKPTVVGANETKSNNFKVIVAAKEVDIIDGYAENQNISKFDLVIDWGWFYWLVKPLFFAIDYFFKLSGNFGIAIILITICIRIAFFPLANMSFKSMARMKLLQPEMTRLKELHKEDKVKLQQEMMALYRREKVNPLSGCFPILSLQFTKCYLLQSK